MEQHHIDILRYPDGKISRIGYFLKDKKHGQWVAFFQSGSVEWVGTYYDGMEYGIWLDWYENGLLKSEVRYSKGNKIPISFWLPNGEQTLFDGNGYEIVCFGHNDCDVYRHYYSEGEFTREERVSGVIFGDFIPRSRESEQ